RSIDTGLAAIDVISLTEAAQSLGASWPTIMFKVIFPNLKVAIISSACLTLATVVGEYTIASFMVGIKAFGPYMSLIGQNRTYESSSLAIISFMITWGFMGLIQLFNRGKADSSSMAGAR
ncbi:MAG: ABC transporter permease subunit, partial [Acetobacterium sp.]|nr:ABC transporter permease subunit [Acetobacterium sp.]